MRSTIWTLCAGIAVFAALVMPGRVSAQSNYNFTALNPLNADPTNGGTTAIAINKKGVVVGYYQDSQGVYHGIVTQPPYSTFTVIDVPGAGTGHDQGTSVYSINADGALTGLYTDSSYVDHGFVSSPPYTSFTLFSHPKAGGGDLVCPIMPGFYIFDGTYSAVINDSGTVAGVYVDKNCVSHTFVSNPPYSSFTTIDAPNAGNQFTPDQGYLPGTEVDMAAGLNDSGMITGTATDSSGVVHGFIYSGGKTTGLDVSGAGGTFPASINSGGVIVGFFADSSNVLHGFQRNPNGKINKFDVSGAGDGANQGTFPQNISFQGAIAGYYSDSNSVSHGFFSNPGGQIKTLSDPNAGGTNGQGTFPLGNNQGGSIVGFYVDSGNGAHGFVATPIQP